MKQYIKNILIAISQLFNSILFGHPDETIAARSYRKSYEGNIIFIIICFSLDVFFSILTGSRNHCQKAHEEEVLNEQNSNDYKV